VHDDWTDYLIRTTVAPTSTDREGPHGGIVNDRGYEHCICPVCKSVGVWSSTAPDAVYCPPPGHVVFRGARGRVLDRCPHRVDTAI
jgi:hypothetical protein